MRSYRDKEACGRPDDVVVIEDPSMVVVDESGNRWPDFRFIDNNTVRAHPLIVEALLEDAEPLWSLGEVLEECEGL